MTSSFTILVVDTRHRCLAPMLESLLAAALARHRPDADVVVTSAGIRPEPGIDGDAVAELARRGVSVPEASVPRLLAPALIEGSDLVLAAARHHRARVVEMVPAALRRTFCLAEFAYLAPRCGWPGPSGETTTDLAELVRHVADARGLVPPDPASSVDATDPEGEGARRVRPVADHLAGVSEDLVRLATGSARSSVSEVPR